MSLFKTNKNLPFYNLRKVWKPVLFQGNRKKSKYFEGWYFKNVSLNSEHIWSIIPGISIVDPNNRHAFIQLINGKTAETWYIKYPYESFSYSQKDFFVQIANNYFSLDGFSLDIQDEEAGITAQGEISFKNIHGLKSTLLNPGIMGWYSFVPLMECNHGLVSMHHELAGKLNINDHEINLDAGSGYSEKDWGRSMPSAWIWMQNNHFSKGNVSFMLSIAKIPWLKSSFTGFLCVILLDGEIHRYASYTGAKLTNIDLQKDVVSIELKDHKHHIKVRAKHAARGLLAAPLDGAMDRRIAESVDASIELQILDKSGKVLFTDNGDTAGLEMVGDMNELPV